MIAQRNGAICRATVDGAVWITHLKRRDTATERYFKLPAARALAMAGVRVDVPEIAVPIAAGSQAKDTYREICYVEQAGAGYLHFEFYNGAMSTEQCHRLRDAYAYARSRGETRVIVLMGGSDYFSNGIHLNVIEAADDPAAESWRNLSAIDDLVRDIVETDTHLVISALGGDAGAGGVPLALAADYVIAREDAVLNPYYQHMGGLYGSEYWTYLLPRRVGPATTARLTGPPFRPVGTAEAIRTGLLDAGFDTDLDEFRALTARLGERIANDGLYPARLRDKRRRRALDERVKPLHAYRDEELARCHECLSARTAPTTRRGGGSSTSSAKSTRTHRPRYRHARAPEVHSQRDLVSSDPISTLSANQCLITAETARAKRPVRRPALASRRADSNPPARTGCTLRADPPGTACAEGPVCPRRLGPRTQVTRVRSMPLPPTPATDMSNATNPQQTRHKEDGWN